MAGCMSRRPAPGIELSFRCTWCTDVTMKKPGQKLSVPSAIDASDRTAQQANQPDAKL